MMQMIILGLLFHYVGFTYCDGRFHNCHLIIPLVEKALQMDLYKVCDLPALHPELKVQFSYVLEGEYLAISMSCTYTAMPTSHEVCICLAS